MNGYVNSKNNVRYGKTKETKNFIIFFSAIQNVTKCCNYHNQIFCINFQSSLVERRRGKAGECSSTQHGISQEGIFSCYNCDKYRKKRLVWEAAKKVLFIMARPGLVAIGNLGNYKKKNLFFLSGTAFTHPPPTSLVAGKRSWSLHSRNKSSDKFSNNVILR